MSIVELWKLGFPSFLQNIACAAQVDGFGGGGGGDCGSEKGNDYYANQQEEIASPSARNDGKRAARNDWF